MVIQSELMGESCLVEPNTLNRQDSKVLNKIFLLPFQIVDTTAHKNKTAKETTQRQLLDQ